MSVQIGMIFFEFCLPQVGKAWQLNLSEVSLNEMVVFANQWLCISGGGDWMQSGKDIRYAIVKYKNKGFL